MRPYAGRDAWFVIRPSALRQSVATQPMHPARHPIVSGCSARAYPPARGHGQGLVSLPELGDHLLGPVPLPVRALHLKLLSATWATKVSRSEWTCSAHPRQRLAATCRSNDHCVTSGINGGLSSNGQPLARPTVLFTCRPGRNPLRARCGGGCALSRVCRPRASEIGPTAWGDRAQPHDARGAPVRGGDREGPAVPP
jgi:hypothetical protein